MEHPENKIHVVESKMDADKYFIFRENNIEVTILAKDNSIIKTNYMLSSKEIEAVLRISRNTLKFKN